MTCLARSWSPVMEEVSAFGVCGPAAKTARARQAARTARAQRGRRPRGDRTGEVGWEPGAGEAAVLMEPGCHGTLAGMIQPPG